MSSIRAIGANSFDWASPALDDSEQTCGEIMMKRLRMLWLFGLTALVLAGCSATTSDDDGRAGPSSASEASPAPDRLSQAPQSSDEASTESEPQANSASGHVAEEMAEDRADPEILSECGLDDESLAYMQRDWERVVDSIGRGDHGDYARAFVTELEALQDEARDCPADAALTSFVGVAGDVADSASDPPDYDLYREAADRGNAWLDELGITVDRLAAG